MNAKVLVLNYFQYFQKNTQVCKARVENIDAVRRFVVLSATALS
jgi:hypothetical protein